MRFLLKKKNHTQNKQTNKKTKNPIPPVCEKGIANRFTLKYRFIEYQQAGDPCSVLNYSGVKIYSGFIKIKGSIEVTLGR